MILTKAYIKELPNESSNFFKVEVPLMSDNTQNDAIFDALLCSDPANYNGYNVGDAVFVHFEDQRYNDCVILGKLFTEIPEENNAYVLTNELKVTGFASLPASTKIGDYTAGDITNLYNATLNSGKGEVDEEDLKQYVQWVNTQREDIEYYANKIRCVTGEEYDKIINHEPPFEDEDDEMIEKTLYFLSTVPESEDEDANL